jgi:hypothetical protein
MIFLGQGITASVLRDDVLPRDFCQQSEHLKS